ncbi:MAG: maltotransferase domain-containing protein [Rhodanobacteraceae bacterium]
MKSDGRGLRSYYVDPLRVGPLASWEPMLARCEAMGFDTLLIGTPFARANSHDRFLVTDFARCDSSLDADDAVGALTDLAEACTARGIALMLDIAPDRCAASNPDVREHPQHYALRAPPEAPPPDPRAPTATLHAAMARFGHRDAADALTERWISRLSAWCDAGVQGYRCVFPQGLPPNVWGDIIAGVRSSERIPRFAAWTPGLTADDLAALEDCGFDLVYSSLPWWDFRADWLLEEDQRLRRIGSVIAPLADPCGSNEHRSGGEHSRRRVERRLNFAAAFNDGVLIPFDLESTLAALPVHATDIHACGELDAAWLDACPAILRANQALARKHADTSLRVRDLIGAQAPLLGWLLETPDDHVDAAQPKLLLVNRDLDRVLIANSESLLRNSAEYARFDSSEFAPEADSVAPGSLITLEPGEVRLLEGVPAVPIVSKREMAALAGPAQLRAARIALENLSPRIDDGRFPVKRTVGETVHVEIDAFCDGHDALAVELLWRADDGSAWHRTRMRSLDNDRWAAEFPLERIGRYRFTVEAWIDHFATQRSDLQKKLSAGVLAAVDVAECCELVTAASRAADGEIRKLLDPLIDRFDKANMTERVDALLSAEVSAVMAMADVRAFRSKCPAEVVVDAERLAARYASWYELFPRSQGAGEGRHGTFDDVIGRLPAIRDMGFDVLYMPPIHPIGKAHRKGRNNALVANDDDPGSPYAIGGSDGGHDAIHPELGGFEDFERLRAAAADLGIEIALDFAIQCSPDHPWLHEHPEWFAWRADGSVRHAENPPKKYEDIVNVDFYAADAVPALWRALRDVVVFWVERGVKLFRVDNPHTKPFPFWEWMIADVRGRYPDVVFLAEAFTRPKPMYRLAKAGFSQSYTYFTWRNGKRELTEYFSELTQTGVRDYFRPHLFVNTPDINPVFLQQSGRAGFLIRAALAATLSGLWGIYSGFELCESEPIPGKEEYLDSEKYQLRARDWNAPGNIVSEISRLNAIRRANPALQDHRNLRFHNAFNDQILYFGKATPERDNVVLVMVNLDPHVTQAADFEAPLWEWDLPDHESLVVEDLMRGTREVWRGKNQRVALEPSLPFAIWRVRPERSTWT